MDVVIPVVVSVLLSISTVNGITNRDTATTEYFDTSEQCYEAQQTMLSLNTETFYREGICYEFDMFDTQRILQGWYDASLYH
jgi:hypothetical protein